MPVLLALAAIAAVPDSAMPDPAVPDPVLARQVRATLAEAGAGPRYGIVVADADGREIVAIAPDERFVPASNTKVLTTVAAYATLPIDRPDTAGGTTVRIDGGDVILSGHGDARMSSAPDCATDCLATLADAVAARTRAVRDVVGDDTAFPDQRWSQGMSWNNLSTRSGTAVSALSLDDNEWVLTVRPGPGGRTAIDSDGYYRIDDRTTVAPGPATLAADRLPGSDTVRLTGTLPADAPPQRLRLAIEDPAHRAAWTLAAMLRARGVRVTGQIVVRHRPADRGDDPATRGAAPPAHPPASPVLAALTPAPLAADIAITNTDSQNLHAELLLRRLGQGGGTGSVADGLARVARVMAAAGLPRTGWDLSDGSGMSTYNRVTPRTMVRLLGWVRRQPWGTAWFATLPVAGRTGTLARRFRGTPLEGRLLAKTGSLNAVAALAGTMPGASGRTLVFATYANDVPDGVAASRAVDRALALIAAAS